MASLFTATHLPQGQRIAKGAYERLWGSAIISGGGMPVNGLWAPTMLGCTALGHLGHFHQPPGGRAFWSE